MRPTCCLARGGSAEFTRRCRVPADPCSPACASLCTSGACKSACDGLVCFDPIECAIGSDECGEGKCAPIDALGDGQYNGTACVPIEPLPAYLGAPCTLRHAAGTRPYCPEGERYCGVPVWKLQVSEYERVL